MDINTLIITVLELLNNGKEPKFNELGVDKDTFGDVVESMQNDGLISGANVVRGGMGGKVQTVFLNYARIEIKGLKYLEANR